MSSRQFATDNFLDATVILFYKYINVLDPENEREIQKGWFQDLSISGRMRISKEGINANLFGLKKDIEEYKARMEATKLWEGIDYKHSNAGDKDPFKGMRRIRVCEEITGTGPMKDFLPTALGGNGGKHLVPEDFHKFIERSKEDKEFVVIDTRNHYETAVGMFENAVDPKLRCFGQFPNWIEANKEKLKDKNVALYCTGGIRCEKASSFVKSLGLAKEVFQLHGGISNYLDKFSPNAGREKGVYVAKAQNARTQNGSILEEKQQVECKFNGVNFQFDDRFSDKFSGFGAELSHNETESSEKLERKSKGVANVCCYCFEPHNLIRDEARCLVCTDFILICDKCLKAQPHLHLIAKPDGTNSTSSDPNRKTAKFVYDDKDLEAKLSENEDFNPERRNPPSVTQELYCPEHMLLGPNYETFLLKLMKKRWNSHDLYNAKCSLERLLEVSDYKQRNGSKSQSRRKTNLQKQISRIVEFLDKYPEYKYIANIEASAKDREVFIPFVPLLNP